MDETAEGTDSEDEEDGASKKKKKSKKDDPNNPDVSLFQGVGVKVRFSRSSENFLMSQLSGGQKALVAMALIFAIQRCDPAPFYLFDELDQALDSTYRAAVASLIKKQATPSDDPDDPKEGTQFICSTFRPELVAAANRCFGISHQNKVSSFHLLSKNDALHFIANLMTEEEAVGEATSLATSKAVGSKGSGKGPSKKRKVTKKAEEENEEEEWEGVLLLSCCCLFSFHKWFYLHKIISKLLGCLASVFISFRAAVQEWQFLGQEKSIHFPYSSNTRVIGKANQFLIPGLIDAMLPINCSGSTNIHYSVAG